MQRFLAFVLAVLMGAPAFADSPVIWNGPYARNLTSKGFLLSNGAQLNNDGPVNYAPQRAIKWTVSGSVTATDDTTAADLARANTTGNGVIFAATGAGNAFFCAALDTADYNKKLALQWDQNATAGVASTYVAGDFQVDVSSATNSTCTTGVTRLPLSTDVSSLSPLPALSGTYRTTFDSPGSAAAFIKVQVTRVNNSHSIVLSNVYVGPGIVTQGAAVQYLGSLAFTPSAGFGTVTNAQYNAWRVGSVMRVHAYFKLGTTAGSTASLTLPTGYTIDSSALSSQASGSSLGFFSTAVTGTTAGVFTLNQGGVVFYDGSTTSVVFFGAQAASSAYTKATGTGAFTTSLPVDAIFDIPIAEWAGSGTVNVVSQGDEFACSTTGTWDAAAAAGNTLYGPSGCPITGSLTAARDKVVQWITPPSQNDAPPRLEYFKNGQWIDQGLSLAPQQNYQGFQVGAYVSSATATTSTLSFLQFAISGSTYNSSTGAVNWSTTNPGTAWRLRKNSGSGAIGFAQVTQTGAGLVTSAGQLLGTNTNDTASLGNAGEILGPISRVRSALTSLSTNTAVNVGTTTKITLTAGDWRMQGMVCFQAATTTAITELEAGISKTTATLPALDTIGVPTSGEVYFDDAQPWTASGTDDHCISIPPYRYSVAAGATQDLYLVALGKFTVSSLKVYGSMYAERAR